MDKSINFSSLFKKANIFSLVIFSISVFFIIFKGLNYGIDFKGGTLIELRAENNINISDIRSSLMKMNLGDVNVKEFGKRGDYLIKIEKSNENNQNFISDLKSNIKKGIGEEVSFRRVEKVGPKVSGELLQSGLIAIM